MRIEDLFSETVEPEKRDHQEPKCKPITKTVRDIFARTHPRKETTKFEKEVFVHLFDNARALGIDKIYDLNMVRVDGLLKLDSGKVVLVEMKYALNWKTSCNARVEFQLFFEGTYHGKPFREYIPEKLPEAALIIFNKFSSDWNETRECWERIDGWNFFYEEEKILGSKFPTVPVRIARFSDNKLKGIPPISSKWIELEEHEKEPPEWRGRWR